MTSGCGSLSFRFRLPGSPCISSSAVGFLAGPGGPLSPQNQDPKPAELRMKLRARSPRSAYRFDTPSPSPSRIARRAVFELWYDLQSPRKLLISLVPPSRCGMRWSTSVAKTSQRASLQYGRARSK